MDAGFGSIPEGGVSLEVCSSKLLLLMAQSNRAVTSPWVSLSDVLCRHHSKATPTFLIQYKVRRTTMSYIWNIYLRNIYLFIYMEIFSRTLLISRWFNYGRQLFSKMKSRKIRIRSLGFMSPKHSHTHSHITFKHLNTEMI